MYKQFRSFGHETKPRDVTSTIHWLLYVTCGQISVQHVLLFVQLVCVVMYFYLCCSIQVFVRFLFDTVDIYFTEGGNNESWTIIRQSYLQL